MGGVLEGSINISFIRRICREFCALRLWVMAAYEESLFARINTGLRQNVKTVFRHSFFGRFAAVDTGVHAAVLGNSRAYNWFLGLCRARAAAISASAGKSAFRRVQKRLARDFYSRPLATAGFIVIVAVLTNLALSFVLGREIGVSGWLKAAILLLVGISAAFRRQNAPVQPRSLNWPAAAVSIPEVERELSEKMINNSCLKRPLSLK